MSFASRVTIDVDSYEVGWRFRATRAAYELKRLADKVEIRISSSGKGIHIVGWFEDSLSEEDKTRLRAHLCDDAMRIYLDELRRSMGHTDQVLWSSKSGKGDADTDFTTIEDALTHIEMVHSDDRDMMRDFVNDGHRAYAKYQFTAPREVVQ